MNKKKRRPISVKAQSKREQKKGKDAKMIFLRNCITQSRVTLNEISHLFC